VRAFSSGTNRTSSSSHGPRSAFRATNCAFPDHVGIVGKTLQTGRPQRVNLHDDPKQIHRDVDKQLNYHTRSLLCVPLRAGNGELLGVFEMINKLDGEFTDDDEQALLELAAQAAPALANTQQLEATLAVNQRLVERAAEEVNLVGACPSIRALQSTLRRVAPTELAVLLLGENGTGKEVVSQSIHYLSPRRNQPFIAVNCAALSETLLESELFGHEKGAFTDAHEARQGKFELATGGTLFLDEIGDLSRGGQGQAPACPRRKSRRPCRRLETDSSRRADHCRDKSEPG
jgi:transcriptional regulator with GAF, ATPase, and Fis domain